MSRASVTYRPPLWLAVSWIAAGVLGGVVAFLLYLEYIGQLTDQNPLISCEWGAIVTCGPNLLSPGGNLLGFTNSILGITLFLGPIYAGVSALATPSGMHAWYWRTYSLFVTAAFALVHYFAFESVFVYGSLCPWCMVIWLVTIPLFWCTAGWTLRAGIWSDARGPRAFGAFLVRWAPVITVVDYALIAISAQLRLDVLGSF